MIHKIRGFYPFKGLFLLVDIRVCERLLSQMSESTVMKYRGRFHSLIEEFYNELATIKVEAEEYEKALNTLNENEQTKAQAKTQTIEETTDTTVAKRLKKP